MRLIAPSETARRVRAALAYSGLEQKDVVEQTGIGLSTLRRIVARDDPRRAGLEELHAIADACEIPRSFMEHGWAALREITPLERRLADLEEEVRALLEERDQMGPQLAELAARAVAQAIESGELPTAPTGAATQTTQEAGPARHTRP